MTIPLKVFSFILRILPPPSVYFPKFCPSIPTYLCSGYSLLTFNDLPCKVQYTIQFSPPSSIPKLFE